MMIIGVDYHPSFRQIAFFVEETGECGERRLNHSEGEAEKFYRDLKQRGINVAKKQKTDRQDAQLLLKLLMEGRFPRIWVPSPENRDLRQLLWHRHRLVQMRTRIRNQLHALAMNENRCLKGKLWSEQGRAELEKLPLALWASRRRRELLQLLDRLDPTIEELTAAAAQEAKKRLEALRLMTHPGVGPITALAFVLIIGTPERFAGAKQIGTYVGLIPSEDSSGGRQRGLKS